MQLVFVNAVLLVVLPQRLDAVCAGFEQKAGSGQGGLTAAGQLFFWFCCYYFPMPDFLEALVGRKEVPSDSSKYIDNKHYDP